MSNFRGYAQKTTVQSNLIQAPDTSDQILQESKRYLQQWKEVSTRESNNREKYLAKLESNFAKEQNERLNNQKLRQAYAGDFKAALDYNHKVKLDDAARLAEKQQAQARQLAAFSNTLGKKLGNIAGQYIDARKEYGRNLALQYDISAEDVKSLKTLDGPLEDYEGKTNQIINDLRSQGASWDRIKQIQSLSGWSMKGLREGEAVRAGENYEAHYWNNYTTPIPLPDGREVSIGQAEYAKDTVLVRQLQGILAGQYINQPGISQIHPNLISQHVQEKVALVHGRQLTYMHQSAAKDYQASEHNTYKDILATKFKVGGIRGMFDMTALKAGKTNFATAEATRHKATVELIQNGVLDDTFLNQLKEYEMHPRDGGKPVLWYKRNHRKMHEYEKAFQKYTAEKALVLDSARVKRVSEEKAEAETIRTRIMNEWETIPDLQKFLAKEFGKVGKNQEAKKVLIELQGLAVGSKLNDQFSEPILYDLLNNKRLTRDDVIRARLSPAKTTEWLKKADEASPFTFTKDEKSAVTSQANTIVEDILRQHGVEAKSVSSSSLTKYKIQLQLGDYFKQGVLKGMGRLEALGWAKGQLDQDVSDGLYDIVNRKIIRKDGKEITVHSPEFKLFGQSTDPTRSPYPYSNITSADVRANPDIPKERGILPPAVVEQYFNDLKHNLNKGYPPAAIHFVTKYGYNPNGTLKYTVGQFLEDQRAYYQGAGDKSNEGYLEIEEANLSQIPAEEHRYLTTSHATKDSTNAILIRNGLKPSADWFRSPYDQDLINNYLGPFNPNGLSTSSLEIFAEMEGLK